MAMPFLLGSFVMNRPRYTNESIYTHPEQIAFTPNPWPSESIEKAIP